MDITKYTNDLLKDFANLTSEPYIGLPQKPIATVCPNPDCRTIAVSVVCNVCGTRKK